jgi:hypothetical protein
MKSVKQTKSAGNTHLYTNEKAIAKFWTYVDMKGIDDCWEWKGGRSMSIPVATESGRIKLLTARKFMYSLVMDSTPPGRIPSMECLCGNKNCLNPTHYDLRLRGNQK